MEDMQTPVSRATPGEEIDPIHTPQAAFAADTPASPLPDDDAEGEHMPHTGLSAATQPHDSQTASSGTSEVAADADESSDATMIYRPVYNGQAVPIRADDTERVTALLRQGLRFEKFEPQFETLRRMSLTAGFHKPEEFVERLEQMAEEQEYEELLEKCGDKALAAELLAFRKQERTRRLQNRPETERPENSSNTAGDPARRMADEYGDLKRNVPEAPAFEDLPKAVVEDARQNGRSLLDAYLRFEYREQRRREEAARSAKTAADSSAGSLADTTEDTPPDMGSWFRKAFQNGL